MQHLVGNFFSVLTNIRSPLPIPCRPGGKARQEQELFSESEKEALTFLGKHCIIFICQGHGRIAQRESA